jgi:type III restriction enzyme
MEQTPDKLSAEMIKKDLRTLQETTEEDLLQILDDNDVIKRNNDFKENGFIHQTQLSENL